MKLVNTDVPGTGVPRVVAELGPGSSLGFGLAALIAGSDRYCAFDVIQQFSPERNLMMFDRLVALFSSRTNIPNDGWCARIFPYVEDLAFPESILPPARLSLALAPQRLEQLRRDLQHDDVVDHFEQFVRTHEHDLETFSREALDKMRAEKASNTWEADGVRQAIEAAGARLFYLPPYSPDLNPIEKLFAKLKAFLRKTAARSFPALFDAFASALTHFLPDECANYFHAAGYSR